MFNYISAETYFAAPTHMPVYFPVNCTCRVRQSDSAVTGNTLTELPYTNYSTTASCLLRPLTADGHQQMLIGPHNHAKRQGTLHLSYARYHLHLFKYLTRTDSDNDHTWAQRKIECINHILNDILHAFSEGQRGCVLDSPCA